MTMLDQETARRLVRRLAADSPVERRVRLGRIRRGALVGQDFACGRWPWARSDEVDVDMEFDIEPQRDGRWDCRANGFGRRTWAGETGGYGSGSITVFDADGVEFLD